MRLALVAIALLAVPTAACSFGWADDDDKGSGVAASGTGDSRSYAVAGFDAIDLRGSDDVDVRVGAGFSVRAQGPSNELDRLRIERVGDTLKVGRRNGTRFGWSKGGHVKVSVTLPRLAGAGIAGSGSMAIDRVEGAKFDGEIAGSGDLTVAALQVERAQLSIAGSGSIRASGNAGTLDVDIAGSGDVDAPGLRARSAKVSIAGSGDVTAAVAGDARIDLMGSGDVDLGPQARCTTSKMGSGTVRCAR